jgi:23S rRNA pseudouridine1911/1915/1917 synthase
LAQRFGHHSRITVNLETGRTHQIRVHMAHRRYPLIGDPTYGGRPRIPKGASDRLVDALRGFSRQALHARTLGFIHPGTNEWVEFECPLPDDILGLIAVLEQEDLPFARDTTLY